VDPDNDGCTTDDELGSNQLLGGRRDLNNHFDFFDTPPRDGVISTADIVAIVQRFGGIAGPPAKRGYTPDFDRTYLGPDPWDLGPPNGTITVADIVLVVAQFGASCTFPSFD